MRALSQGTRPPGPGCADRRACPDAGAGAGRGTAGASHLTSAASRHDCVGVLLAGGAARRFGGRPKGLAVLNGRRIADHALLALSQVTSSQLIVANDVRAEGWFPGWRIVRDDKPGLGPLAGIETALAAAGGGAVLVLAWDMPFVPAALLQELVRRGERGSHAIVPVHGGWPEPLCAYYHAYALPVCRRLLAQNERHAAALAATLPSTELLRDGELAAFGDPEVMFTSVDSPEQLADMGGAPP